MITFYDDYAFGILDKETPRWLLSITMAGCRMWSRKSEILFGKTVDSLLERYEVYGYKQKYFVIQSPGHFIHSKTFFTRSKDDLESSLFLGHLLLTSRKGAPTIHDQCMLVNMEAWKHMGRPNFQKTEKYISLPDMGFPEGHHHDDYTPRSITRLSEEMSLVKEEHDGSLWIQRQLMNHGVAKSFNKATRDSKFNIYTHTKEAYEDSMDRIVALQEKFKQTVYFHETDLIDNKLDHDITTIVTVASGLRVPRLLTKFPNARNVIIYDVSSHALEFQKMLHEVLPRCEADYINVIREFKSKYPEAIEIPPARNQSDYSNLFSTFLKETSHTTFLRWKSVAKIQYINADLLSDYHQILSLIGDNENIAFDVSNVFTMPLNFVQRSYEDMREIMNDLIKEIKSKGHSGRLLGFNAHWDPL